MADSVTLEDVVKAYGPVMAVDHVNLDIRPGEFFSLLGPSGCGKTTTLRIIAGFEEASSGIVKIGSRIVNDVPAYRRNVGLVFQNLALFPHLRVFDNIAFGLRMKKTHKDEIKKRVDSTLELVGLKELGDRRIRQLSGGQQQRVALARALVREPSVLCLDEPLGALDLKLRLQMQLELRRLHKKVGNTFIFVTHDQSEAITMSDRVAVMNQGRVEQVDEPNRIYEQPRTKFVADFIGETNILKGKAEEDGHVAVAGLRIKSAFPPEFAAKEVYLSVRPEKIEIGEAGTGIANRFDANVEDVVYKGSYLLYRVNASGVTLSVQGRPTSKPFKVGENVKISWAEDAATVVER